MTVPVSELEPPSRSSVPRALGLVVAVLLVAAIVSAVLVRGDDRSPAERFAAIPAAVSEEPFAFEISLDGEVPDAPMPLAFEITGAADPATERTSAQMEFGGMKISFVSEGMVVYLLRPGSTRWTKIDGGALSQGIGSGLPSSTNPLDSFEQLRAVDSEIEEVGEEDVRGTSTTHYRARLDMAKVLAQVPEEQRAAASALGTMEDVPVDVWLDDDDRPRRQRMVFAFPGGAGKVTINVEAFDFGKAVDIELPAADLVDDGGGLFGPPPS